MSVEARRGCGYRKVGGLYLVSDRIGVPCHRLPLPLDVCPTCNHGIKQSRGWTWIDASKMFAPPCERDAICLVCPACGNLPEKAGLIWIGERFYKEAADFTVEANELGVSRRIKALPRGFKLGETWVYLGHPRAVCKGDGTLAAPYEYSAGIFHIFKPSRVELILTKSQATTEKLTELDEKGITPVIVPDNDPDHQGTVYDKEESEVLI